MYHFMRRPVSIAGCQQHLHLVNNNGLSLCCSVEEAVTIAGLLDRNTEELGSLLRALNGEYVLPEAGGDLLRVGAGVLPTGA